MHLPPSAARPTPTQNTHSTQAVRGTPLSARTAQGPVNRGAGGNCPLAGAGPPPPLALSPHPRAPLQKGRWTEPGPQAPPARGLHLRLSGTRAAPPRPGPPRWPSPGAGLAAAGEQGEGAEMQSSWPGRRRRRGRGEQRAEHQIHLPGAASRRQAPGPGQGSEGRGRPQGNCGAVAPATRRAVPRTPRSGGRAGREGAEELAVPWG